MATNVQQPLEQNTSDLQDLLSKINTLPEVPVFEIVSQPISVSVKEGGYAYFTVCAVGEGLTYQWQYSGIAGTWGNSTSATVGYNTPTLQVVASAGRDLYKYRCVVTDANGKTIISDEVTLDVIRFQSKTATENGTVTPDSGYDALSSVVVNVPQGGGGLPSGFTAIAKGTHTLGSAVAGGSQFTVDHNLGVVPDMFLFYATANIATTYSMLSVMRSNKFGWRSTSYLNKCWYHGNSTTTVTGADVTTTYGIKSLTATQAIITTYSSSTSYFWRAGTYEWVAIKFS